MVCTADFLFGPTANEHAGRVVTLKSGDVIVFGGGFVYDWFRTHLVGPGRQGSSRNASILQKDAR